MLDSIIRLSLENRLVVVMLALVILVVGSWVTLKMPVDVFPDLTAPTVTIMTEGHGMAPEEVETLVTVPIESAVNGATGVRRVRSATVAGLSTVWVEFNWGTDIYRARQVVNEKLQGLAAVLPTGAVPVLTPISSIMGEIMYVGLFSDRHSAMEVKETAQFVLRKRLLSVPGVANVVVVGGENRQYRIELDPQRLAAFGVTVSEVLAAVRDGNENFAAGLMQKGGQDYLIRGVGRISAASDLEQVVVAARDGVPVLLRDVAAVGMGAAVKVGDASIDGQPGVLVAVGKHPEANTMELTRRLEKTLAEVRQGLPPGMMLRDDLFRQADFINRSIDNIKRVLLEGAVLVIAILFLFLGSGRTTAISVIAMPISLIFAIFTLRLFDISINTMTLGGMAIAIGVIVDDAIIDVENVYRRLRENRAKAEECRHPVGKVIFDASKEIRSSIVNATLIIILVFLPLFFLTGVEGRLLKPLGISYMVSIGASLLVALTLTPALCSYLLPNARFLKSGEGDGRVMDSLQRLYKPLLAISLSRPRLVIGISAIVVALSLVPLAMSGRSFLPPFNEGSLTLTVATAPGTSLSQSAELGGVVERLVKGHPNVLSTARRTGRGDLDEHGKPPNVSEIEVRLDMKDKRLEQVLAELRELTRSVPGVVITFGQPISHRIDHMMSGTMANIAIKLFGPELSRLRSSAEEIRSAIAGVPGLVDLSVEQQNETPQVRIMPKREAMASYNLSVATMAEAVETATAGTVVSRALEKGRSFEVAVRFPESVRSDLGAIGAILIDTPAGIKVPLSSVAEVVTAKGPSTISRENVQRKIVIQANVAERDLRSVFDDVRQQIEQRVNLPDGYFIEYGGQFESEAEATRKIALLSILSLLFIFLILYLEFRSARDAVLIMVNLPLAFIGGILAVFCSGGTITVASLVGFITLFGIATRNGILLVSHYRHLLLEESLTLADAVERGSRERLRPVVMTALAAGLALVPFAVAAHDPGNEILSPLAIVILGGLVSSTVLNMLVLPSLYLRFAKDEPS